jgi:hypothetical protein
MNIKNTLEELKDLNEDQLYAGLSILSKNIEEYLIENKIESDLLEVTSDKSYMPREFLLKIENSELPKIDINNIDFNLLKDKNIVHEWTVGPGRVLMDKFMTKFKEVICGKDGPYEKICNGLLGQADLPATIVATILSSGISAVTFWAPLAIYIGLLLTKTALKTYCEA